jgi:hypothetical protein
MDFPTFWMAKPARQDFIGPGADRHADPSNKHGENDKKHFH